jgi:hypothetical protein
VKKKSLSEIMGGGATIGVGGMNSDGPHNPRHVFKNPTGYHTGGYTGNADSQISQRHALSSTLDEDDEYIEEEDLMEEEGLMEFFARIIKLPLTESDKKEIEEIEDNDEEEGEAVKEMSAGGVAGVATPLGTNSKGKVPSKKEQKNRIRHAIKTFSGK